MTSNNLLQPIRNGRSKPQTIQDVADRLGIHKSTVSLALSGKGRISVKTRESIVTIARQMGFVPNPIAQRLAKGYRNPVVCIFSGVLDIGLATEKILLLQRKLSNAGYEVPIYVCSASSGDVGQAQASQLRQICRQRPQVIICAAPSLDPSIFEELTDYQAAGGHVISYDSAVPIACDQVIFDRAQNGYSAARYLIDRGHRRLGLALPVAPDRFELSNMSHQSARAEGFAKAITESGGAVNNNWIFRHSIYERGGEELAHTFLALKDRPTGICVLNDYVALSFMVSVLRSGVRLPQDLSIVGHDNQPICNYCPVPLTSATQPAEEIVEAVVRMVSDRLHGNTEPPRRAVVVGRIVERQSVVDYSG